MLYFFFVIKVLFLFYYSLALNDEVFVAFCDFVNAEIRNGLDKTELYLLLNSSGCVLCVLQAVTFLVA